MSLTGILNRIRCYLIEARIKDFKSIDGWLTPQEAIGLYQMASQLGHTATVVEIGTWKGKSTYCIAKGLKSGKIFSIDPFDASGDEASASIYSAKKGKTSLLEQFESKMKALGVASKIVPMKGLSSDFVGQFKDIDFLFIDGDHSIPGCTYDFESYSPHIKKGGFIAFHDFDPGRKELGPTWVIQNRVMSSPRFQFAGKFDSLWVAKKIV